MYPTARAPAGASLRLGLVLAGIFACGTGLGPADLVARPILPGVVAAAGPLDAARLELLSAHLAQRLAPPPPVPPAPPPPDKVWPLRGAMTGWFGEARGNHLHPGLDLDGHVGEAVLAAASGVVAHAGPAPAGWSGYGVLVLVDHGGGIQTAYAHLSSVAVAAGRPVTAGQLIGAVGTTGKVSGSHLHFEVRSRGVPVNPRTWLPARP